MRAPKRLAVIGQGYVGLPLAMLAVEAGYDVIGIDLDESRAERLRRPRGAPGAGAAAPRW